MKFSMNKYIRQLKQEDREFSLHREEKQHIRDRLASYMHMKPVRITTATRHRIHARQKQGESLFFNRNHMFAKVALMLVIALSGGTTVAAHSALPGDALYGVKIHVNENIESAFAVSTEAKAKLQAKLAERRAADAEALKAKGELSAEAQSDISTRIETHANSALQKTATLKSRGDADTAAQIELRVERVVHSASDVLGGALNIRAQGSTSVSSDADKNTSSDTQVEEPSEQEEEPAAPNTTKEETSETSESDTQIEIEVTNDLESTIGSEIGSVEVDSNVDGEVNVGL